MTKEIDKNEDFSLIVGIAKPEQVIKQLIKWHFHPIRSFILSDHGEIPLKQILIELQKGENSHHRERFHRHKNFFDSIKSEIYIIALQTNFDAQLLRLD